MKKIQFYKDGEPVGIVGMSGGNADAELMTVRVTSKLLTVNKDENTISPLTENKNTIPSSGNFSDMCTVSVSGRYANFEDRLVIAYQGNTSIRAPKKGFTLDFEKKHRIGDWREMDSFHLKAYYTDWMHTRDIVANRLIEDMYKVNSQGEKRPYFKHNNFGNDYRARIDVGAMCHIDGIPCELYINDVYWGIYSLNIKKNRDNYLLDKNDKSHIQIETGEIVTVNNSFSWSALEVRNPKKDSGNDSFVEGVEPNAGEVKTAWLSFMNKLTNMSASDSKDDINAYLNSSQLIESILHADMIAWWDSFGHNTLYTTWDGGVHWSVLEYDMDLTFGVYSRGTIYPEGDVYIESNYDIWERNGHQHSPNHVAPWLIPFKQIFDDEIKAKYAYYRKSGVFSVNHIVEMFNELTRQIGYDAYKRDAKRWEYANYTSGDGVDRIASWIEGRIAYLDTKYG